VAVATRDSLEAVNAFRHATSLSPNFAYAHAMLGVALALGGKVEEAIQCINHAVRLSPRDTFSDDFQLYYAFVHFQAGRYAEAASYAEASIQLRPEHPMPHIMAAAAYGLGDNRKAAEALAKLKGLVADVTASDVERNIPYAMAEDRARVAHGLRKAGLAE
jgi:adenylate cyclase